MRAYEILGRIHAGLQLCGMEDGELQWMGTMTQWSKVEECEREAIKAGILRRIFK